MTVGLLAIRSCFKSTVKLVKQTTSSVFSIVKHKMDSASNIHVPGEKQEINVTINNMKKKLTKLCNEMGKLDMSKNTDTVPCDIVDLSWLAEEKSEIMDNVQELEDFTPNVDITEVEMLINLYHSLLRANQELEEFHNTWGKPDTKPKTFLDFTKENQKYLVENKMDSKERDKLDVELLLKKSGEKMRETRNNLHDLLDTIFENTNTKQLLQDLTVAYFQGGDNKYINLADTEYSVKDINILKKSNIITEDPYDRMKIKINDLV